MSVELSRQIVDQVQETAHTVIFHFQGEPLLNRQLPEMIRYAHEHHLFTLLSTNAQVLTEELAQQLAAAGLDRIIISIDGLTQETYEHYRRGGRLEKALNGMRCMAAIPRCNRPEIVMQCLRLRSNEKEWDSMKKQYHALGADRLELKTAQLYDYVHGHPDMPSNLRYARYLRQKDGTYTLKKALHNRCYRLWSGCVITTEGEVLPCCYDKSHRFSYGNMQEIPFPYIMQTVEAYDFRDRVLQSRRDVSICRNCDE